MLSTIQTMPPRDGSEDPDRKSASTLLARLATDAGAQRDADGRLVLGTTDITDFVGFFGRLAMAEGVRLSAMPAYTQIVESMTTTRYTKSLGLPRDAYSTEVARECHDALFELYDKINHSMAKPPARSTPL